MMKVFLDTNIFLDMIVLRQNREDNENAAILLDIASLQEFDFFISPLSISNSFYIIRKDKNAAEKINARLQNISILPMGAKDVSYALKSCIADKEDALQISCARQGACDVILTRNTRHFADSPIPALTPSEFLARLGEV